MSELGFTVTVLLRLLPGLPVTLGLTAASLLCGGVLALALTRLRLVARPLEGLVRLYCFAFRGSPLLMQIFLIYYGFGQFPALRHSPLWPILREPAWCAILALSLNTAAYTAEFLRGGLAAVPAGAVEAGRAHGMSRPLLFRRIVLPLAIRQALPAYGSEVVVMVKSTSLASIITVADITGIASGLSSESFRPVEVFTVAGALYLAINVALTHIVGRVERALDTSRPR